jgi:hypothetical protein
MLLACAALAAAGAGCGSSSAPSSTSSHGSSSHPAPSSTNSGAAALTAEAQSAATGDIPDNQQFLVFNDAPAHYSVKFPEGWAQQGAGRDVTFAEKNNLVHILVLTGGRPTAAGMRAELAHLRRGTPSLSFTAPAPINLASGPAIKSTYTTLSAANQVTGKQVVLTVDRYELAHGGRRAIVDLGTARGVDNVDAYRMMINSFRWH